MTAKRVYTFLLITLTLLLFNFQCTEPIPEGSVVVPIEVYDSLRAGAIIKEVEVIKEVEIKIPPDYDSVNSFWAGKLTSELSLVENKLLEAKDSLAYLNNKVLDLIQNKKQIIQLTPNEVKVDTAQGSLSKDYFFDNIPYINRSNSGTRWGASGYPHQAVFKFDQVVKIDSIDINVFGWDENYTHTFKIYNFSDLLLEAETKPIKYSGHKINFVGSQLYLEITGGKNGWTDVGEIKMYEVR
jgi:hypothetical protein